MPLPVATKRPGRWAVSGASRTGDSQPRLYLDLYYQLTMPPEDLYEVASWLLRFRDIITGHPPPASASQPVVSPKLNAYIKFLPTAADAYRHSSRPDLGMPNSDVLGPAQLPPSSAEEITTAQAEDLAGFTANGGGTWRKRGRSAAARQTGRCGCCTAAT
jgi:hypothetical protein